MTQSRTNAIKCRRGKKEEKETVRKQKKRKQTKSSECISLRMNANTDSQGIRLYIHGTVTHSQERFNHFTILKRRFCRDLCVCIFCSCFLFIIRTAPLQRSSRESAVVWLAEHSFSCDNVIRLIISFGFHYSIYITSRFIYFALNGNFCFHFLFATRYCILRNYYFISNE